MLNLLLLLVDEVLVEEVLLQELLVEEVLEEELVVEEVLLVELNVDVLLVLVYYVSALIAKKRQRELVPTCFLANVTKSGRENQPQGVKTLQNPAPVNWY